MSLSVKLADAKRLIDVQAAFLTAAVHAAPNKVLDLGSERQFTAQWENQGHKMVGRSREGRMEYVCLTCHADAT